MIAWIARRWRSISIGFLGVITILSLIPLPELPSAGGDKLHHYVAYFLVAFPVALSLSERWWLWVLSFLLWSGAIELVQPLVNRNCELLDLLANAGGLVSGVVLGALAHHFLIKNRR